jgi:GcrA cell cycle regulator
LHGVTWLVERVERLRRLWLEKTLSASEIASEFGVTRNAVLGKVFRLGLIGTRKPNRHPNAPTGRQPRPRIRTWKPPRSTTVEPTLDDETMQEFLALDFSELTPKTCRYPHGEAVPYEFCGQPVRDGSPYCAHHHAIVYIPASNRRPVSTWRVPV